MLTCPICVENPVRSPRLGQIDKGKALPESKPVKLTKVNKNVYFCPRCALEIRVDR